MIVVVSGLPRSGTSMLMQMLAAGGLPVLSDGVRAADADNPAGYLEFERVRQLATDTAWLDAADGHAVKIVSALLRHLPARFDYRVLFMRRPIAEVLASQRAMLVRRGQAADPAADAAMAGHFERHLAGMAAWLERQGNLRHLDVEYGAVVDDPQRAAGAVVAFLERPLDRARMAAAVRPALHRQRVGPVAALSAPRPGRSA